MEVRSRRPTWIAWQRTAFATRKRTTPRSAGPPESVCSLGFITIEAIGISVILPYLGKSLNPLATAPGGLANTMQTSTRMIVDSIIFQDFLVERSIFGIQVTGQDRGRMPPLGERFTPGHLMRNCSSRSFHPRDFLPRTHLRIGASPGWSKRKSLRIPFFSFCPIMLPIGRCMPTRRT